MARIYEESQISARGSNAFTAYLKEKPEVGIYALKSHLEELDNQERKWGVCCGTNWGIMEAVDVNWMRASAHVRLANLYNKTGQREAGSDQIAAAWSDFSKIDRRVRGITNQTSLLSYVQHNDELGHWW